jgi:hypothetical protein
MFVSRNIVVVILLGWAVAAFPTRASAQTSTATLSANVGTVASLTHSAVTIAFPDADPDLVAQIPATGGPLLITAKSRATQAAQVVLSIQAADDLRSGVTVISASNITWTGSGAGFVSGTLSKSSPTTVAAWTGSGIRTGSQQFFFANRWTHPTGTYTLTMTYTLTAP